VSTVSMTTAKGDAPEMFKNLWVKHNAPFIG